MIRYIFINFIVLFNQSRCCNRCRLRMWSRNNSRSELGYTIKFVETAGHATLELQIDAASVTGTICGGRNANSAQSRTLLLERNMGAKPLGNSHLGLSFFTHFVWAPRGVENKVNLCVLDPTNCHYFGFDVIGDHSSHHASWCC